MSDTRDKLAAWLDDHCWLSSDEQRVNGEWTWGLNCECGEFVPDREVNLHLADALLASDVLNQLRAETWDEGWRAAQQVVALDGEKTWAHTVFPEGYEGNPYRIERDGGA